ncbi:hypothetical protein [Phaeobacter gallaeciensis]|nr:hypothetical protein [Phaeobacter gallaeciensis]
MTRAVEIIAHYPEDADAVFRRALQGEEMLEAMRGLAVYHGFPEKEVQEGDRFSVDVTFLGLFTTRNHVMNVVRLDREKRLLESEEHNPSINRWDHTLSVTPAPDGCRWVDRIIVDAGWKTPLVARFCRFVYLRRHKLRNGRIEQASISRN